MSEKQATVQRLHPSREISENDVGTHYCRGDGSVWQLVGYSDRPTVTFRKLDDVETVCCVVGSPLAGEYTRLVPER